MFLVVGSIFSLASCSGGGVTILENQPQNAANKVLLILWQNGIDSMKKAQGEEKYSVMVNEKDQVHALSVLNNNGQPNLNYSNIGEIFKKDSFISSPLEEEARFIFALNQEISSMLMQFDGVVDVKVDVSLPRITESLWKKDNAEPSAAVIMKYKPEYKVNLYINRIKQLVANAVPGLSNSKVEVLIIPITDVD